MRKVRDFKKEVKVGYYIRYNAWCQYRYVRVEYIGKRRGMGTVFYGARKTTEVPFTWEGNEMKIEYLTKKEFKKRFKNDKD